MAKQRKREKKEPACYSDYVVDVPKIIQNNRHGITYTRLHFIGSGSYGKCFEVVKQTTKEMFACKVVSRIMLDDDEMRRLLQSEVDIHRKLNHQYVAAFIHSFEDDKYIYMVQGLCVNNSLRDLQKLRGNNLLTVEECRYFVSQIMKGAQYIHAEGVIHRDLKLSNILVDTHMQIKISDFGLAIRTNDPRLKIPTLCGTTNYLAPEVVTKRGFTCGTDVWAIGVITFVLAFGYKPFEEYDAYTTHQRIIRADYRIPTDDVSHELKELLRRIFQKDVILRATATECLKLDFFRMHSIPHALPPTACRERASFSDVADYEPSSYAHREESLFSPAIQIHIDYPKIVVKNEQQLESSFENEKYAVILEQAFNRFDAICRFQDGEEDVSIDDITGEDVCKPLYWITNWMYDQSLVKGFIYKVSDGSKGMLFPNGTRVMKSPDKLVWKWESCDEEFTPIRNQFDEAKMAQELKYYYEYDTMLDFKGTCTPLMAFSHRKSIHLYTWLQTSDAMVMVLSNNTVQINFTKNHMKFLICPQKETMSFVANRIIADNINTVTFDMLAKLKFSKHSFILFKYIAAVLQYMAKKLREA